jgi:predicted XRE-type DNA-binding protein
MRKRSGTTGKDRTDMRKKQKERVTKGSGNIFADLGLPNPEQELLKARLTLHIYKIVKARGLTQAQAGAVLGIKQPHVSALMRNRAGNFSVGRLIAFLTALGAGRGDHGEADAEGTGGDIGGGEVRGVGCRTG